MADSYSGPQRAAQDALDARMQPVDEARQEFLRKASTQDPERKSRYSIAETYYDGSQTVYLTDRLKEYLELHAVPYQENYCEVVVDAMVERLALVGVTSGNAAFDSWAWSEWWDQNRGDGLQLDLHTEAAKKGDAYLILEWDEDVSRVCAYVNGPERIIPCYMDDGDYEYVAKVWETKDASPTNPAGDKVKRMNLYYPDRVEKWFTPARDGGESKPVWGRWMDDSDRQWPIDWTYEGKPIGIPVFHFSNKARSDHYGRPEHWATIPQQNRLNKELLDLSAVLDQLGFPQRYAIGISTTSDLKNVPGEVWRTDVSDAQFGQFDAADPEGLLKAVEATLLRIATRSNTPGFRFIIVGGYPSGESQKVAEAGLVAKVKARQVKWGGVWADVFRMAGALTKVYANETSSSFALDLNTLMTLSINPQWADPETRNEKEHLETLQLMNGLGVSKQTLLTMMPGIDAEQEMKRKEAEDEQAAELQARAFDMGGGLPAPPREPVPLGAARNGS